MIKILVGDCRVSLLKIKEKSVQVCVTSPPYFGLRSYDVDPLVWGGRGDCAHSWFVTSQKVQAGGTGEKSAKQLTNTGSQTESVESAFCQHCQAWRGSLGLEPTLELYISYLVEIFRETRRVLRDNGVLILNLGDSYSAGGGDRKDGSQGENSQVGCTSPENNPDKRAKSGLPAKNLLGIPWRVALALQADGWYLRSAMPWLKASAMPESVRDRPTTAHEYVFLLSKSKKYYWDADAIRVGNSRQTKGAFRCGGVYTGGQSFDNSSDAKPTDSSTHNEQVGRNYRTTDAYIAPLDHAIGEAQNELARLESIRDTDGLLLDDNGDPVALKVNPGNFKGSHFATFPVGLVEPFVKAGSKNEDTVLDIFGGAMTTMMVSDRLGRDGIACELNPDYAEMGRERLVNDGGMFMKVVVE